MKEIKNPFEKIEGYNCFGCSPKNPIGLHLHFKEEGDLITATWQPEKDFQGWVNILHGGIQSTLMDEIASWVVFVKMKTSGFTSKMEVKLLKSIFIDGGPITLLAKLIEIKRNFAVIDVEIQNQKKELCTKGTFTYFTYSKDIAKEKFHYPEEKDFY